LLTTQRQLIQIHQLLKLLHASFLGALKIPLLEEAYHFDHTHTYWECSYLHLHCAHQRSLHLDLNPRSMLTLVTSLLPCPGPFLFLCCDYRCHIHPR
jgi:ABC-type nickel/cobalt efflux system permease component RcnA